MGRRADSRAGTRRGGKRSQRSACQRAAGRRYRALRQPQAVPVGVDLGLTLIDINLAPLAELETLPGIGPSKAAAILANRPYVSIDDLTRVPGIGEKTVEQLRAYITVQ